LYKGINVTYKIAVKIRFAKKKIGTMRKRRGGRGSGVYKN